MLRVENTQSNSHLICIVSPIDRWTELNRVVLVAEFGW